MSLILTNQQADGSSSGELTTSLAHELHQLAQPLTILQGVLELSLLQAETAEDFRNSTEEALAQLQRVMHSLRRARNFLQLATPEGSTIAIEERKVKHV